MDDDFRSEQPTRPLPMPWESMNDAREAAELEREASRQRPTRDLKKEAA